jgi:bis(5'-nucleosidyl)-tetraphosphatase
MEYRAHALKIFPHVCARCAREFEGPRLRELMEETGRAGVDFPFGEEYRETLRYSHNKVARYYLGETEEVEIELPVSTELGRPEHHEYRWVSFDEAEELLPPRLSIVLDWAKRTLSGS